MNINRLRKGNFEFKFSDIKVRFNSHDTKIRFNSRSTQFQVQIEIITSIQIPKPNRLTILKMILFRTEKVKKTCLLRVVLLNLINDKKS